MIWYFDTSVLVAGAVANHPHHAPALESLEALIRLKHSGCTSAHSLAEVYSVLTRTPFQPPIYPAEAWQIIDSMILPHLKLVTLDAKEYQDTVRTCAIQGWTGGKVHDAVHLRCAKKAKCDRIYTFNLRDFRALASDDLRNRITQP